MTEVTTNTLKDGGCLSGRLGEGETLEQVCGRQGRREQQHHELGWSRPCTASCPYHASLPVYLRRWGSHGDRGQGAGRWLEPAQAS